LRAPADDQIRRRLAARRLEVVAAEVQGVEVGAAAGAEEASSR